MLDQTLSLTQLRPPPGFYCPGQFVREPNGVCVLWLRLIHLTHTGAIFFQLIFNFLVGFFTRFSAALMNCDLKTSEMLALMVKWSNLRKKKKKSKVLDVIVINKDQWLSGTELSCSSGFFDSTWQFRVSDPVCICGMFLDFTAHTFTMWWRHFLNLLMLCLFACIHCIALSGATPY